MANLISREDILVTLLSIGVVLPPGTKISNEVLSKKLTTALDAAQDLPELLPGEKSGSELDVRNYPLWPAGEDVGQATGKAPIRTLNIRDQFRFMMESGELSTEKEDTFKELRQAIMGIGNGVKDGHKHFCLLDEKRNWGVYVRVRDDRVNFRLPVTDSLFTFRWYRYARSRTSHYSSLCIKRFSRSTMCLSLKPTPSWNSWGTTMGVKHM